MKWETGKGFFVFGSIEPASPEQLREQFAEAVAAGADGVEVVLNRYVPLEGLADGLKACGRAGRPVCLRVRETGEDAPPDKAAALAALAACVRDGLADVVDVEAGDAAFAGQVRALLAGTGAKLILTRLEYRGVPGADTVWQAAQAARAMGPDGVRVLYLCADDVDMLEVARAARRAAQPDGLGIPFCISTLGEAGLMLRLFGERCGNAFGSWPLCRTKENDFTLETLDEYQRLRAIYDVGPVAGEDGEPI